MRQLTSRTRHLLQNTSVFAFSGNHSHHGEHPEEAVALTRHNPLGEKDLRGFEHLEKMNENEKSYSPLHSTVHNSYALYSIFSWFPNSIARRIGQLVAHPKSAIASDTLYLPRITENGIPIYDSIDKSFNYSIINRLATQFAPALILTVFPQPGLAAFTYGVLAYVYYSTNWATVRNLVVKVELSPQTEEIIFQKISFFGGLNTQRVRVADLERVTFEELFGENSISEKSTRGLLNRDVAFRNKQTGELLLFDKTGIWSEEGLNHPLVL